MNATAETPTIQILFAGLLAVSIDMTKSAAEGRRPFCEVGVLDGAPGHETRILIAKYDGGIPRIERNYDRSTIRPFFSLDVRDAVKPGIRTAEEEGLPEHEHLKWAVDLEGREVYGRKVRVNPRGFHTIFHLNNGTFHTAKPSGDDLEVYENGRLKAGPRRVAVLLGSRIALGGAGEAVFVNGPDKYVFSRTEKYLLVVSNSLPPNSHPDDDANLYYPTIGGDVAPDKMIKFKGTHHTSGHGDHPGGHEAKGAADLLGNLNMLIDPHAVCFSSCLGQSTCS